MTIGYIGLGKMGKNMVLRMLEQQITVVAWNRSTEPVQEVVNAGAIKATDFTDMISKLRQQVSASQQTSEPQPETDKPLAQTNKQSSSPNLAPDTLNLKPIIIWLMLPAGQVIDDIIGQLVPLLQPGDLLIDGANSNYKDTLRRAKELESKQIRFIDVAVSGGPSGARNGACLFVGGSEQDFKEIKTLIEAVAAPKAFEHCGSVGAGHFAKMVHNGIEYGMMQAIAEGAEVLQKSQFNYDLAKVFALYNNRSVIESRLVGWAQEAVAENPSLEGVSSTIAHSGEGAWTVEAAKELGVAVPIIEESLEVRKRSAGEPEHFSNKVVTALRGKFGGHSTK